jgi:8-oxo-dGTP pyrophosphatase MutT (NUDIX family)
MKHFRIGSGGTKVDGKSAAAILFTDGKSMLLLKRAGEGDHIGTWALPGGKAAKGETEIGTATREAREETGLASIPGFRFDSLTTHNGKQKFTVFFYKVQEPFSVTVSKEHSESAWVRFDEIRDYKLHPKFKEHLPDYLHKIRRKTQTFEEWAALTDAIKSCLLNT